MPDKDDHDKTDLTLPISGIAECYCDVYSGPPWNQSFDQLEVETYLEGLSQQPGVTIRYLTEKDSTKVIAFYIAQEGQTFNEIQPTFINNTKMALKAPINGIDMSAFVNSENEMNNLLLKAAENTKEAERLVCIMDLGIRPGNRDRRTILALWNEITDHIGDDGTVIASTSSDSQIALILKGKMDVFLALPIGDSKEEYLFFTCPPSKIPRFNKKTQ